MKNNIIQISRYCRIQNNKVFLDNRSVFDFDKKTRFSAFIRACYKDIGCDYPRFYKMDNLCKLGYITAEYLLGKDLITDRYEKEKIGIMILNSNASLYSDSKFYQGITSKDNYFPEPAVFVYTLPNIVIGEISIRFEMSKIVDNLPEDLFGSNDDKALMEYLDISFEQNNKGFVLFKPNQERMDK